MRHPWQLDDAVHFLNHGSFGATPRKVLELQSELRATMEANPVRFMVREYEARLDHARDELAKFVGAKSQDVVFVNNATTGVNAVLRSLDLKPGDELLTFDHAYNACVNALRFVAEKSGARVVVAQVPFPLMKDEFFVDAIRERVTSRTKLVLLERVTSPTALVLPINALVEELEGRGIPVLVDAAHAPGQVPLNLDATNASFTTGNLHKWVCAPKGCAFLHVRKDWQDRIHPTTISHGANSPRTDRSRFQLEFDWVGTDDPTPYFCVPIALKTMGELVANGWPGLMARNRDDALEMRQRLMHVLPQELSPARYVGSMASIVVPGATRALSDRLQREFAIEVPVFQFGDRAVLRVSAQRHVREEDVDALVDALRKTVRGAKGAA
ncbi:MAG: aminotransferase class V-fold PLP-dependent enzyme [Archangium sp.]